MTWRQYLDELPQAGYVWTELGPQGFLPQDPAQLRDELERRGLKVCGGTVFASLHQGKEALDKAKEEFGREARLLREVGAKYLVHLPDAVHRHAHRRGHRGRRPGPGATGPTWCRAPTSWPATCWRSSASSWCSTRTSTRTSTPRSGSSASCPTPTRSTSTSASTPGHIAYCHGDNVQIVERFPERITYVHLKQVDPAVRDRVLAEKLPLSEAVKQGAMVEPPYGEPAMPPLLDALAKLDRDVFCVIEQDLYPVAPDVPLPIAARTAGYFAACGVGPTRRWPY